MFGDTLKACNSGVALPVDLTQGLVAHYLLNNNSDDSHGTYNGTDGGSIDYQGDIADFDGSTDYTKGSSTAINGNLTISAWIKPDVSELNTYVIQQGRTDADLTSRGIGIANLQVSINSRNSAGSWQQAYQVGTIPTTDLTHVVGVFNGSIMSIYINGVYNSQLDTTTEFTNYDGVFVLGATSKSTPDTHYDGKLSNVRIYNEAKDQAFINALYKEGYYPKPLPLPTTNGLVAHYPLTGTAEDTTGNYDGTEVGNTYVDNPEFGSVADFDGANDYISLGNITIPTIKAVSFWVQLKSSKFHPIVTQRHDYVSAPTGVEQHIIGITSSNTLSIYNTEQNVYIDNLNFAKIFSLGTMYNIILVDDGTFINLYVDGIFEEKLARTEPLNFEPSTPTLIGYSQFSTASAWISYSDILLADLRIFSTEITQQEVIDIYNYEKNFRPIDIDDGLVAYYPLANNSMDNYYNEYDGVDTSMTYDGLSGVFNGTTSKSQWGGAYTLYQLNIHSCSMWIKRNGTVGDKTPMSNNLAIFGSGSTSNSGTAIITSNYSVPSIAVRFMVKDSETYTRDSGTTATSYAVSIGYAIDFTQWVHVAYTLENNRMILYINGEKVDGVTSTQNVQWSNQSAFAGIGLQQNASSSQNYFDGNIAHNRVYNKVITAEQVAEIYNSEKGDFI